MLQHKWKEESSRRMAHAAGWCVVALLTLILTTELLHKHFDLRISAPEVHWGKSKKVWHGYQNVSYIFSLYVSCYRVVRRGCVHVLIEDGQWRFLDDDGLQLDRFGPAAE